MKPLAFNLRGAKKIAGDNKSSTFQLGSGHQIRISHAALPPEQRKSVMSMPLHADEGADVGSDTTAPTSDLEAKFARGPGEVLSKDLNSLGSSIMGFSGSPASEPVSDTVAPEASSPSVPIGTKDEMPKSVDTSSDKAVPSSPSVPIGTDAMSAITPQNMYATGMAGVAAEQQAAEQRAQGELQANKQNEAALAQHQQDFEQGIQSKNKEIDSVLNDIKTGHINPNSYMQNMQTPQKVATAIGLFLGGWGSAYTHQGNPAMEFLNKQIDRDIESQKANMENKKTLLGAYYDQTKNMYAAENMARATQLSIYANQFQDAALNAATPMAAARAKQGELALKQQMYPYILRSQWAQTQANLMNSSGGNHADAQVQGAMLQAKMNGDQEGYKDLQSRYLPGIGLSKVPLTPEVRSEAVSLNSLDQGVAKAKALQQKFGESGAWSVKNRADAESVKEQLAVSLGQLYNLKRINDHEFQSYQKQIGNIGSVNAGGTLEGLKNLQSEVQARKQSLFGSLGVEAPAQASAPKPSYKAGDKIFYKGQPAIVMQDGTIRAAQ